MQSGHLVFRISELSVINLLVILKRLSVSSNSEFLDTSKYSVCFRRYHESSHINILVLQASIANSGTFCTPVSLFCKFCKTLFMYSVFVTSMLQNSGLVWFSCVRVPRNGRPKLRDSTLRDFRVTRALRILSHKRQVSMRHTIHRS